MTKEELLATVGRYYDSLQGLNKLDNFYDYEKAFVAITRNMNREILEKNLGGLPADHRKKNFRNDFRDDIDEKQPQV